MTRKRGETSITLMTDLNNSEASDGVTQIPLDMPLNNRLAPARHCNEHNSHTHTHANTEYNTQTHSHTHTERPSAGTHPLRQSPAKTSVPLFTRCILLPPLVLILAKVRKQPVHRKLSADLSSEPFQGGKKPSSLHLYFLVLNGNAAILIQTAPLPL